MAKEIEIFADEIICPIDFNNEKRNILGICCLFVPVNMKKDFVNNLLKRRCLNPQNHRWNYDFNICLNNSTCNKLWHEINNCEIHNKNIRCSASDPLKKISKRWIKYLIEKNKASKAIRFNILFIELDNMDISQFGTLKVHENMYNKFFRTTLNYGLKSFFNNSKIDVVNVFQDKGSMEKHSYFPSLNLHKLGNEIQRVAKFKNKEIIFVDSDHKVYAWRKNELYNESNIIQFVDLILGSISQCLFYLSDDSLKKEYASMIYPLVKRLVDKPRNSNSSWNYLNRQNISFFPKSKGEDFKTKCLDLNGNLIDNFIREFHRKKKLEMPFYDPEQKDLSQFF